ncbi:hypothetical protein [Pseudomonas helleri]|uniref:Uncharacterized protein n=1 Tax=Pseudomonas helleri TaxID=1608996 RepID=A0A6A7Z856_9PSED|nr:hypothetical protein [Pseudomonas helleri]MQT36274.1 hypothetical protein [Pseudomonas helleri]MQU23189.1 hypothetical protein [Pseudomonas helleri]MQU44347.1 hypothetical protein [Pseudomonas helleri]MQU57086.1 hypothetical protein [Pseudomonas helleri]
MPRHKPELAHIYNIFGLSSNHELSTLLINIETAKRFSDLLHAVEREFFMIRGEPSEEPEDADQPVNDKCSVNCWQSTPAEYLKQFKAALPIAAANAVPAYEAPVTGEKWSLDGENGSWDYDNLNDLLKDNYGHDSDGDGHPASYRAGLYEGGTVYRGIVCKDDPARFLPDADDVTERMYENACDSDAGEWVDAYPDLSKAAEAELQIALAPLKAWARKHCQPDFFTIKDITPHTVTAEDVSRSRKS